MDGRADNALRLGQLQSTADFRGGESYVDAGNVSSSCFGQVMLKLVSFLSVMCLLFPINYQMIINLLQLFSSFSTVVAE